MVEGDGRATWQGYMVEVHGGGTWSRATWHRYMRHMVEVPPWWNNLGKFSMPRQDLSSLCRFLFQYSCIASLPNSVQGIRIGDCPRLTSSSVYDKCLRSSVCKASGKSTGHTDLPTQSSTGGVSQTRIRIRQRLDFFLVSSAVLAMPLQWDER